MVKRINVIQIVESINLYFLKNFFSDSCELFCINGVAGDENCGIMMMETNLEKQEEEDKQLSNNIIIVILIFRRKFG